MRDTTTSAVAQFSLTLAGHYVYLRRDDTSAHAFDGCYVRSDRLISREGQVVYNQQSSTISLCPSLERSRWELHRGGRLLAFSPHAFTPDTPWSIHSGIGLWYTPSGEVFRLEAIVLSSPVAVPGHEEQAVEGSGSGISLEVQRVVRCCSLYQWGVSAFGQIIPTPKLLNEFGNDVEISSISAGAHFALAADRTGVVYGWGDDTYGELPSSNSVRVAVEGSVSRIEALEGVKAKQVACGDRHALIVTGSGGVLAFGDNRGGQCGVSSSKVEARTTRKPKPVAVDVGQTGVVVACGARHSALVTSEGHLYTWGHSGDGKLIHQRDHYGPRSSMVGEQVDTGWDEEDDEGGTKENRRPPGVAISSRLKTSVVHPRMVYSLSHAKVTLALAAVLVGQVTFRYTL